MIMSYTTPEGTFPIITLIMNYLEVYSNVDVANLLNILANAKDGDIIEDAPGFIITFHE